MVPRPTQWLDSRIKKPTYDMRKHRGRADSKHPADDQPQIRSSRNLRDFDFNKNSQYVPRRQGRRADSSQAHAASDLRSAGARNHRATRYHILRQIPSYKTKRLSTTHHVLMATHAPIPHHRTHAEDTTVRPRDERNTLPPSTFAPPHRTMSNTRTGTRLRAYSLRLEHNAYDQRSRDGRVVRPLEGYSLYPVLTHSRWSPALKRAIPV